jgi:type I restriction-modification system DNA methylase subunit
LVLKKRRDTTDVRFVDKENSLERMVPLEEIRSKDHTLSVSAYVQKVEEKVEVDRTELEMLARRMAIKRIRLELETSRLIASFEGWDYSEFIAEIRAEIDAHEAGS